MCLCLSDTFTVFMSVMERTVLRFVLTQVKIENDNYATLRLQLLGASVASEEIA